MENHKLETLGPALEAELNILIDNGQPVVTVKRLREATGCGLADAVAWLNRTLAAHQRLQAVEGRQGRPCPYCRKPLRSDLAQQCFECEADWHDAGNVVRRKP